MLDDEHIDAIVDERLKILGRKKGSPFRPVIELMLVMAEAMTDAGIDEPTKVKVLTITSDWVQRRRRTTKGV